MVRLGGVKRRRVTALERLGRGLGGLVGASIWGWLSIVVSVFAVLVAMVFIGGAVSAPFVEATDVFEVIISIVWFFFICVVMGGVIFLAIGNVTHTLGHGWSGLLTGEQPPFFRLRAENLVGIWVHLPIAIGFGLVGFLWFSAGRSSAQIHFSTNGLLLVFSALFFGVAPLIPRLYFFFKHREDAVPIPDAERPQAVLPIAFVMLTIFSMSIVLGVNDVLTYQRSFKEEFVMAYGEDYSIYKNDYSLSGRPTRESVRLIVDPPADGIVIFKTYECPVTLKDATGQNLKTYGMARLREWGLVEEGSSMRTWAFDARAGERVVATMKLDNGYCTAQYRLSRAKR